MQSGLAKIMEKVRISRNFERPQTDLLIAENAVCIDYADTWSSKRVHWLSKSHTVNCSTTYYGCENKVEFDIGVAWASVQIARIHPHVAHVSKIQWLQGTPHNTGWMDHHHVCHESFEAIPILDPADVNRAYCDSASRHHCLQWHVQSHGSRYASFA